MRRQLKWKFRKPLIVFTPKSLLRHPKCVSSLDEMSTGNFQEVIDDATTKAKEVDTVVFCTGKFYYDLLAKREEIGGADNIALVRIEQLYPLPQQQLDTVLKKYTNAKKHIWAQEEPKNMGAWASMVRHFKNVNLDLISLRASGAPATGSSKAHAVRHGAIINKVFENALVLNK